MSRTPAEVIIVGAGLAGLLTALHLAPHPVTLLSAGALGALSSSAWAQGGIAAAIGPLDTPLQHLADTISAGAGLVEHADRSEPALIHAPEHHVAAEQFMPTVLITKANNDRLHLYRLIPGAADQPIPQTPDPPPVQWWEKFDTD